MAATPTKFSPEAMRTIFASGPTGLYTSAGVSWMRDPSEKPKTPLESRKVPQPYTAPLSVSAMLWLSPGDPLRVVSIGGIVASFEGERGVQWLEMPLSH